jgi:L-ascorbate metabolism protein UlaG (beta-lactamase superfamily)
MMPEETVQASIDLQARLLLPVHWGKFTLSLHTWNEPIQRVIKEATRLGVSVTTPLIGEPVILDSAYPSSVWWEI